MDEKIAIGGLIARVGQIVSRARIAIFVYFAAIVSLGTVIDYYWSESAGYLLLISVVSLIAGYLLMQALMHAEGLAGGSAAFGAYFGLSLIIGIGTIVGFLVLIIPGIIIAVRWLPAYALLLSGDETAGQAPGASWDLTSGQFWPLLAALLIGVAPLLTATIGLVAAESYWIDDYEGPWYVASLALTNVMLAAFTAFTSALGIAAYAALRGERGEVAEVFA